jgi:plastocyanin
MRTTFLSGASVAVASALLLWSCGGGSGAGSSGPTAPSSGGAGVVSVAIVGTAGNQAFNPNPVTAAVGDTVMFKNNDSSVHHIVFDDGSADLGEISPGATSRGAAVRGNTATNFHCILHSSMVGTINGQKAPEPPPCPDPLGYGC